MYLGWSVVTGWATIQVFIYPIHFVCNLNFFFFLKKSFCVEKSGSSDWNNILIVGIGREHTFLPLYSKQHFSWCLWCPVWPPWSNALWAIDKLDYLHQQGNWALLFPYYLKGIVIAILVSKSTSNFIGCITFCFIGGGDRA